LIPRYRDLPIAAGKPARSSWGVFGDDDEIGTLNLIGPDQVRRAATLVRTGAVFSLNWALEMPDPPLLEREPLEHHVKLLEPAGTDDYYDNFYPQASSQWDALSHIEHLEHGYYNGRSLAEVTDAENPRNGIEHWSRRGIAGRFVLIDIGRSRVAAGRPIDCAERTPVAVPELERALQEQGVALEAGDILLLRFGWIRWYESLPQEARNDLARELLFPAPGLAAEERTAEWLWDHRVAAVAADVPALEAMPFDESHEAGFLHYRLLPLLGYAIGEFFALDALAAACASDGVYDGMLTAAPLNKRGGSGSPANALGLR
jgi:kynurenine formamidase